MEFGDAVTADVSLILVPAVLGPFRLHSSVLGKSDFFKAQLSEAWASDSDSDKKPAQILVKDCKDPTKYLKCLELLYMPKRERHFSSVEEALGILEVAAQLLCQELIDCCMNYLEAVPWTSQQELAIRSCISFLNLKPTTDLALRLPGQIGIACGLGESTLFMLEDPAQSPLLEDHAKSTLLEDLATTVTELKGAYKAQISGPYSKLMWLIQDFQRLKVADEAVKFLAEEKELAQLVWEHVKVCNLGNHECRPFVTEVLNGLFGELQNGKVVVCRTVRIALVTSWFPVFSTLYDRFGEFKCGDWLESVVESLPLYDRQKAFIRFIDLGFGKSKLFNRVSSSWCSLLNSIPTK